MPFVHSLVRSTKDGKQGWCAPVELGESAPHYMNFVIPVAEGGVVFSDYSCEVVTTRKQEKSITVHEFSAQGTDSFLLRLEGNAIWFVVKPVLRAARRLPYIGCLKHPDFRFLFTEVEPVEPDQLDELCEREHTFIMGCDPFTNYAGIKKRA